MTGKRQRSAPRANKRRSPSAATIAALAVIVAALIGAGATILASRTSPSQPPIKSDLQLDTADVDYVQARGNTTSILDVRLRNSGTAPSDISEIKVAVDQAAADVDAVKAGFRFGPAFVTDGAYTLSLSGSPPGSALARDVAIEVGPDELGRIVIALGAENDEVDVDRVKVTIVADDGTQIVTPALLVAAAGATRTTHGLPQEVIDNELSDGALPPLTAATIRRFWGMYGFLPKWL